MLKIIGETLLIATRMDRAFEPNRDARNLPEASETQRTRNEIHRLPRFWQ